MNCYDTLFSFITKGHQKKCFLVNFATILRTAFLQNTQERFLITFITHHLTFLCESFKTLLFMEYNFFLVSTILSTLNKKQNLTLHIWLHLLKKSLMENFISCAVLLVIFFKLKSVKYSERITSFMRFRHITQCIHKTKGMGKLLSKKSKYR